VLLLHVCTTLHELRSIQVQVLGHRLTDRALSGRIRRHGSHPVKKFAGLLLIVGGGEERNQTKQQKKQIAS
jgi:hypothetical protein